MTFGQLGLAACLVQPDSGSALLELDLAVVGFAEVSLLSAATLMVAEV